MDYLIGWIISSLLFTIVWMLWRSVARLQNARRFVYLLCTRNRFGTSIHYARVELAELAARELLTVDMNNEDEVSAWIDRQPQGHDPAFARRLEANSAWR